MTSFSVGAQQFVEQDWKFRSMTRMAMGLCGIYPLNKRGVFVFTMVRIEIKPQPPRPAQILYVGFSENQGFKLPVTLSHLAEQL